VRKEMPKTSRLQTIDCAISPNHPASLFDATPEPPIMLRDEGFLILARSPEELAELEKKVLVRIEETYRKLSSPGCDDIIRIRVLFDTLEEIKEMRRRSHVMHYSSMDIEPTQGAAEKH
jgi:hypothetical protein